MGSRIIVAASMVCLFLSFTAAPVQAVPAVPKIDSMVMSATQPANTSSNTIWYDNFDVDRSASYFETSNDYSTVAFGNTGKSMLCYYPVGETGTGVRHLAFGDCPISSNRRRSGEKFTDVYWRVYVKYPSTWVGDAAAKLSRCNQFAGSNWSQAGIVHVWGGDNYNEMLDPATGVSNNVLVSTTWNDFANLSWLGQGPGTFKIAATSEIGRWVCVECRMKLNSTNSTTDGYAAMWIDGKLDAECKNKNFRGTWDTYGINAIFLETYWNGGAPVDESRYIDDFVISTTCIGPVTVPANPTMYKTPLTSTTCTGWEVIITSDSLGANVVWSSTTLPGGSNNTLVVSTSTGTFSGTAAGLHCLPAGPMYFSKVRQQDSTGWSAWSYMHQPFYVETVTSANKPYAPADLSATGISSGRIDLAWIDLSANESGFIIQRKAGSEGTYATLATVAANALAYSDTTTAAGTTYYYRVCAYNSAGSSAYSNEAGVIVFSSITITSPNGGEVWSIGQPATVTWTSIGSVGNVDIDLSTDGGATWTTLVAGTANDGSETITVPDIYSTQCKVRVRQTSGGSPYDVSDANFAITVAGDSTLSDYVDGSDLNVILANWGATDATWATGDLTGDGIVDGSDLNVLLSNWNRSGTRPASDTNSTTVAADNTTTVAATATTTVAAADSTSAAGSSAFTAQVNFQPASVVAPQGYVVDSGLPFSKASNGYTYGWATDLSNYAVQRNNAASPDVRYDTAIMLVSSGTWEMAVPNGMYDVKIVSGDGSSGSASSSGSSAGLSAQKFSVEGVPTTQAQATSAAGWSEATVTVVVTDGRLTITATPGSSVCFVQITGR